MEILSWSLSLLKPKSNMIECFDCEVISSETLSDIDLLKQLASQLGLPEEPVKQMVEHRDKYTPGKFLRYWAVFDVRQRSNKKRLHIFDLKAKIAKSYFVAHGKGSDENNSGYCTYFSNRNGSGCTSRGIYLCAETYISGKFGLALRLDGLDASNSNARGRAVVFHGSTYSEDSYVKGYGKTGRSLGCPAVGFQYSTELINNLKNGSYLNIWTDQ